MIFLYNSLTKKKEKFVPLIKGKVSMYVCGPTVYDKPHLGNARSVVVYDILYRILRNLYQVENVYYVRNITDVDDKINKAAKEREISINLLTNEITKLFHENMKALNCLSPTHEPKATEHISQIITIINSLIENDHAYVANKHVYFSVNSDKNYGKLASRELDEMIAGARIKIEEAKLHPGDFVLWKPKKTDDDSSSVFDSPWGKGRPGWHIECSAMSYAYLGKNFDIHGGGVDLKFPHHCNEIAQSTCAFSDCNYANIWVHNGFLTVNKEKMSKSLGNYLTVSDLLEQGIKSEAIRYLFLTTHYRKPLDYNDNALADSLKNLDSFYKALAKAKKFSQVKPEDNFMQALHDDLNVPKALAILHNYVNKINKATSQEELEHQANLLKYSANLLGILEQEPDDWFGVRPLNEDIQQLINKRTLAKSQKDWQTSDQIRQKLKEQNIILEDNIDGTTSWRYK